jgi:hypothetical protein
VSRPARNRPPKLEPRVDVAPPTPPSTCAELIERSKVAGPSGAGLGPTELRRKIERLAAGDRRVLGELSPIDGVTTASAWSSVTATFGATADAPVIDAARTLAATRHASAMSPRPGAGSRSRPPGPRRRSRCTSRSPRSRAPTKVS